MENCDFFALNVWFAMWFSRKSAILLCVFVCGQHKNGKFGRFFKRNGKLSTTNKIIAQENGTGRTEKKRNQTRLNVSDQSGAQSYWCAFYPYTHQTIFIEMRYRCRCCRSICESHAKVMSQCTTLLNLSCFFFCCSLCVALSFSMFFCLNIGSPWFWASISFNLDAISRIELQLFMHTS